MKAIIATITFLVMGRRSGKNTARNLSKAMNTKLDVETSKDNEGTVLVILQRRSPKLPPMRHSKPIRRISIIRGILHIVISRSAVLRFTIR